MKFTQEDLLNAMGLKVGDTLSLNINKVCPFIGQLEECQKTGRLEVVRGDIRLPLSEIWEENIEYTVITPPKYTLTETEKHIVLAIDEKWKWIARDMENSVVILYLDKPKKTSTYWEDSKDWSAYCSLGAFPNHFQFIQWSDTEPVSLDELREIAKK